MMKKPNKERMYTQFKQLVQISSQSFHEEKLVDYLQSLFLKEEMIVDIEIIRDNLHRKTRNMYCRLNGKPGHQAQALFFSTHLDTVNHDKQITVKETDTAFYSDGRTILGADPKMAITCMIELIHLLKEAQVEHPTIQFILTGAEEAGCIGANFLNKEKMVTRKGYVLDHVGAVGTIFPSSDSHASLKCEIQSLNGETVSKRAKELIQTIKQSKVHKDTKIEVRDMTSAINNGLQSIDIMIDMNSVTKEMLTNEIDQVARIYDFFKDAKAYRLKMDWTYSISGYHQAMDSFLVECARKAIEKVKIPLAYRQSAYITDTNYFHYHGMQAINLGVGYEAIHTNKESIPKQAFTDLTELMYCIVQQFSK